MLVAFVESIKYVGHMLPIAFLRIFLGYFYFNQALVKIRGDFLVDAYLAEDIRLYLARNPAPLWFKSILETVVIPNWQYFAITLTVIQLLVGISYIIGYLVRPFSLAAVAVSFFLMLAVGPGGVGQTESQAMFILVLHLTLGWMGAGRCLGIDYYFYKRRRGIWW